MSDTGSGLDGQFGIVDEGGTVGSGGTPDRFFAHEAAPLTYTPTYVKSNAIQAGETVRNIANTRITRHTAGGTVTLPLTYENMGIWWKYLIGSSGTASLAGSTDAYEQIHVPGGLRGKSFAAQIGKPVPDTGTVEPRNYPGCKVPDWTLTYANGELIKLDLSIDAWDESTTPALATASYVADNPIWSFGEWDTFTIGGTPNTASGETTITGGSAVTSVISNLTIKGTNALKVDRFGGGSSGSKSEQLQNGFTEITGSFEGEFNPSQFETPFKAGTTVAFQIDLTSEAEIESGFPWLFSVIIPAAKIIECPAELSGTDLVSVKGTFEAGKLSGHPAIQVKLVNTDTAI